MRQSTLTRERRLIAVFIAGLGFFFSPLILLFDRPMEWFGIPILYLYLFGIWFGLIAVMAWIIRWRDE